MPSEEESESFEVQGHFWLPAQPDKQIAGILKFDRDSGGTLSLIGNFRDENEMFSEPAQEVARIVGQTDKKLYTLDGCLTKQSSIQIFSGVGRQQFSVSRIIEGALYEPGEEVTVDTMTVSYTYLLNWTNLSGISTEITFREGVAGFEQLSIKSEPVENQVCSIPAGELTLQHSVRHSDRHIAGQSVSQHVQAKFDFKSPIPLDRALDAASDLQDLLTFANDRVCAFESVHFSHPDLEHEWESGKTHRLSARLFAQWRAKAKINPRRLHLDHDMCFTYAQLGGAEGVGRFMCAINDYRSQVGRVSNTRYNTSMFLQDILLARVASLESFHAAKYPNKKVSYTTKNGKVKQRPLTLLERLEEVVATAGDPFTEIFGADADGARRLTAWLEKAKDERNNVAHHLGRDLHGNAAELFYVAEAAYWLFVIAMMREASSPADAIEHLRKNRRLAFTGEQLRSFL